MPPDLGRHEQKAQPRRRQGGVPQLLRGGVGFALEQQQPAVEVVGQHDQLKVIAVHVKAARRMGRQSGVVVGFFDKVLRPGALIVKPHHHRDRLGEMVTNTR